MTDLEKRIEAQKDLIEMREIGNDMYFTSPQYKEDMAILRSLEDELNGVVDPLEAEKKEMLEVISQVMGSDVSESLSNHGYATIRTYFNNCRRQLAAS